MSEKGRLSAADVALHRHGEWPGPAVQHQVTSAAGSGRRELQRRHVRAPPDQRHQPPDHLCERDSAALSAGIWVDEGVYRHSAYFGQLRPAKFQHLSEYFDLRSVDFLSI